MTIDFNNISQKYFESYEKFFPELIRISDITIGISSSIIYDIGYYMWIAADDERTSKFSKNLIDQVNACVDHNPNRTIDNLNSIKRRMSNIFSPIMIIFGNPYDYNISCRSLILLQTILRIFNEASCLINDLMPEEPGTKFKYYQVICCYEDDDENYDEIDDTAVMGNYSTEELARTAIKNLIIDDKKTGKTHLQYKIEEACIVLDKDFFD